MEVEKSVTYPTTALVLFETKTTFANVIVLLCGAISAIYTVTSGDLLTLMDDVDFFFYPKKVVDNSNNSQHQL